MNENIMRIQKYMAMCGVASRRAAEAMIADGRVRINGRVAQIGCSVDYRRDVVELDGKRIRLEEEKVYLMLNKPRGYVATMSDEQGRKCVAELVADVGARVYPVGRLDLNSEGLLLMTNDGDFAYKLTHPRHGVSKVYHVSVRGDVSAEQLQKLNGPMTIDDYVTVPAQVSVLDHHQDKTALRVVLHEGRNRQIRKMCEQVGLYVCRLRRIAVGDVSLGTLKLGKWRLLTFKEVQALLKNEKGELVEEETATLAH
ncbi:MAG: rRNA pseudouridine synthase [Clostridia bacterium]|nr:rRNA pseudouridine synthase [Clostridia bacterium]